MDLNTVFMGVSVLGNETVGSRFSVKAGKEVVEHFPETGGLGFAGILNRGPLGGALGLPFDIVDIVLGYQGLPTASLRDFVDSGLYGRQTSAHSLGTLDRITAYKLGLSPVGGRLDSVPFGNVAPSALQVNLGTGDLVNGGVLGKIFNPSARLCSMGPTGHPMGTYRSVCP
jgi:filamentous hemagglutinin